MELLSTYYPHVDIMTFILCIALMILKRQSYEKKEKKQEVLTWLLHQVTFNTILNVATYCAYVFNGNVKLLTWMQNSYFFILTISLITFTRYICEIFDCPIKDRIILGILSIFPGIILSISNTIYTIIENNTSIAIFRITYVYYCFLIIGLIVKYKKYVMKSIFITFSLIIGISYFLVIISSLLSTTSFVLFTYLLPVIASYYLLHNNTFNIDLGMYDMNAFSSYVDDLQKKQKKFVLISLYLDIDKNIQFIKEIKKDFFKFYDTYLSKSYTFKISDNRTILIIDLDDYKEKINFNDLYQAFLEVYAIYNINYKLIFINSEEMLNKTKSYLKYAKYLEQNIDLNDIYFSTDDDIKKFINHEYIIEELSDINKKNNLNDDRVLVYCQPVYNTITNKFDTAEILMRLRLNRLGFVFPDSFINIAENEGYIHALTKIILNKSCQKIKELEQKNIHFSRISINVSMSEIISDEFYEDIKEIISQNDIEFSKIAIELTESTEIIDLNLIKNQINKLKELGIYFYLDDFGTGYSNFERILQLPIDIIKFDRSLVIMSNEDENFKYMVKNFTAIFKSLHYKILFEGIENLEDEKMCIEMGANYLQGYKYSKPIPIDEIGKFVQ